MKPRDRIRETITLCSFILAIAVLSTVLMDLLIYPLSKFAVSHTAAFNYIMKDLFWIVIISIFALLLARRIYILRKDGFSAAEILRRIGVKPLTVIAACMLVIACAGIIITLLYVLLYYNYYFLYKLTGM